MLKLDKDYEARELQRLKDMMADPRYWKYRDEAYVAAVRKGFEELYDNPPPRAIAREGEAANELGLNGPNQGRDTDLAHVTPGEIVVPLGTQTVEVLNALYAAMGDRMAHFVVGSGCEQRNPVSGLPAFADDEGWFTKATRWHFEERDERNHPLPGNEDEARKSGFLKYPERMDDYHQNKVGKREKKYAHPDGREVVFDGDTGKVVTDLKLRGTFNYAHQELPLKDDASIMEWAKWIYSGAGHVAKDIVPYWLGGNVRGAD